MYEPTKRKYLQLGDYKFDVTNCNDLAIEMLKISYQLSHGKPAAKRLAPGTYTKKIRGTTNFVENHSNEFFESMATEYPTFEVISTNTVALPDSICMYITYRI